MAVGCVRMKGMAMNGIVKWSNLEALHRALLLKGLTQNRLAALVQLNRRTVAKLFNRGLGSAYTVRVICEHLDVPMEELLPEQLKEVNHA